MNLEHAGSLNTLSLFYMTQYYQKQKRYIHMSRCTVFQTFWAIFQPPPPPKKKRRRKKEVMQQFFWGDAQELILIQLILHSQSIILPKLITFHKRCLWCLWQISHLRPEGPPAMPSLAFCAFLMTCSAFRQYQQACLASLKTKQFWILPLLLNKFGFV